MMSTLKPGDVIDDTYQVERLLGSGGMAHVYVVKHLRMPRKFALKVLQIEVAVRRDFLERFEREAEILATLRHPHIVDVIDRNKLPDGNPYLVMELLEGEDLATFIARSGALSVPVALRIANQIGEALEAAHHVGITHRDLKPSNIFLCKQGHLLNFVKVLDFGIAKLAVSNRAPMTAPAQIMGTPGYMAPEQARGEGHRIGPATDQFALAATLYEMLVGQGPFYRAGDTLFATIERVVHAKPEPLPDPQINASVQRALSKEPENRFPTLQSFLAAVGASTHTVYDMPPLTLRPSALTSLAGESARITVGFTFSRRRLGIFAGALCLFGAALYAGSGLLHSAHSQARDAHSAVGQHPGAAGAIPEPIPAPIPAPTSVVKTENNAQMAATPPEVGTHVDAGSQQAERVTEKPDDPDDQEPSRRNTTVAETDAGPETEDPEVPEPPSGKTAGANRTPKARSPVRVVPSIKPARLGRIYELVEFCNKGILARLPLQDGTLIRLQRAGTLTVVAAPASVIRSGFNECLRQQLAEVAPVLLPEKLTLTIRR